ncbi:MAG: hypothetical protein M1503_06745, partial [Thaumarchaeota archaeon]|nr:hypothetical protein [Nitrososphaerota archaeon]
MRFTGSNQIRVLAIVAVVAAVVAAAGLGAFQSLSIPGFVNSRVTVSGSLQPLNKVDIAPTRVEFINTSTEEKFSAPVEKGHYSIDLPNHVFYRIQVTWTLIPGARTGTSDSGTLNLNCS